MKTILARSILQQDDFHTAATGLFCWGGKIESGLHQENSTLLEWLERVSPVIPARQHISWTYVDMPESSTRAGEENCWNQLPELDLVQSAGTSS